MEKKVAIIIVTYNSNKNLLRDCLKSVKKLTDYKNYKIIISDNGSPNNIAEIVRKEFKWVDLLENKKNLGFGGGNNVGIKYALEKYNPDYYFLLNDDTKTIQKNWLGKLVQTAESKSNIGIVGCKLIYPDGSLQHLGGFMNGMFMTVDKEEDKKLKEVDHIMGSALLIKKSVIERIGLIDEIFTPYLLEETDYCLRAKSAGFKIVSDREVSIIHYKGQSIDNTDGELKRNFIRMKNDTIFSILNLSWTFAFLRIFFYLPLVMVLRKKTEKKPISIKNIEFRTNFFGGISNIFKGYYYVLTNFKIVYLKRKMRKGKKKIWY